MNKKYEDILRKLFLIADVKINGDRPWDMKVHNPRFYGRVLKGGELAIGESYMDGDWDTDQLAEWAYKVTSAKLDRQAVGLSWQEKLHGLQARIINMQSKYRSYQVGKEHYDVGNDLYEHMLDKRMIYSCGYWRDGAGNLDEAQERKLDLICRKIGLKKGDSVLDIGCGWGGFLIYAAERYGINGVGISVSKEQVDYGRARSRGLPIEILFQDYREPIMDPKGGERKFDHAVSVGMFEHVGSKNYQTFMEIIAMRLKPKGLFLLHTIGQPTSQKTNSSWTHKYIFPNSQIPSLAQITKASEGILNIEDVHVFGMDYYPTLLAWHKNFNNNWNILKNLRGKDGDTKYDERFRRMWNYYLLGAAGMVKSQQLSLWQIVFSRGDISSGYQSVRQ